MFNTGDVVQLKSGGPDMTVQRLIGDKEKSHPMTSVADEYLRVKGYREGDPVCHWFVGAELKSEAFRQEMLKIVPPPQQPPQKQE